MRNVKWDGEYIVSVICKFVYYINIHIIYHCAINKKYISTPLSNEVKMCNAIL